MSDFLTLLNEILHLHYVDKEPWGIPLLTNITFFTSGLRSQRSRPARGGWNTGHNLQHIHHQWSGPNLSAQIRMDSHEPAILTKLRMPVYALRTVFRLLHTLLKMSQIMWLILIVVVFLLVVLISYKIRRGPFYNLVIRLLVLKATTKCLHLSHILLYLEITMYAYLLPFWFKDILLCNSILRMYSFHQYSYEYMLYVQNCFLCFVEFPTCCQFHWTSFGRFFLTDVSLKDVS